MLDRAIVLGAATLLFVQVLLGPIGASAHLPPDYEHELWIDDYRAGSMVVDQAQTREDAFHPGPVVGQTFVPRGDFITRIDVRVHHDASWEPAVFTLWEWKGDHASTTAETPLYRELLDMQGPFDIPLEVPPPDTRSIRHIDGEGFMVRHMLPNVRVTPGATYYFQIERHGTNNIFVTRTDTDTYPFGTMIQPGIDRSHIDLAFIVYSGQPTAPTISPLRPFPPTTRPVREDPRPPLPTITKADYLAHIRDFLPHEPYPVPRRRANACAFLYHVIHPREEQWAQCALAILRTQPVTVDTPSWFSPIFWAYWWIRDSSSLTPDDHRAITDLLYQSAAQTWPARSVGANNRAMGHLFMFSAILKLFPNDPMALQWQEYVDRTWNDWYLYRDVEENAQGYHMVWGEYLIGYLLLNDRLEVLTDPDVKAFFERYRDQVTPLGALPSYGDTGGWGYSYGGWTMLFEAVAAQNGDPTFKWAAHKVYDYVRRYIKNKRLYEVDSEYDLHRLAVAYLVANDSIPEVEPPRESRITWRRELIRLDRAQRDASGGYFFRLTDTLIPDKLILKSNPGPNDIYALFDLVDEGGGGHGHYGAPNLVGLTVDDTVILNGPNYWAGGPDEQNSFLLKKVRGGEKRTALVSDIRVTKFVERDDFTFAELSYKDPFGYGHDMRRQVFLVKNQFLWIRDVVTFAQTMELSIGPVWGIPETPDSHGDHWFDLGWAEPQGDTDLWRNGDQRLVLYFVPQRRMEINWQYLPWKTTQYPWLWSPPYTIFQRLPRRTATQGQRAHFNTLALPHGPDQSGDHIASSIRVLHDSRHSTLIHYMNGGKRIFVSIVGSTPHLVIVQPR